MPNIKEIEIQEKAYRTGAISNDEFSYVIRNLLCADGYVLDTGINENVNAELLLRITMDKKALKRIKKVIW